MATLKPGPLSVRRIIARRAAFELTPGAVFNLGAGISAGISNVLAEENMEQLVTSTVEAGVFGGIPGEGLYFGSAYNPQAIIDQPYMFDFYSGGGLDVAFVSFAGGGCRRKCQRDQVWQSQRWCRRFHRNYANGEANRIQRHVDRARAQG